MVVYLPIAFIKDCICNLLRKRSGRSGKNVAISEVEIQASLNRKDSEVDLSAQEEGKPLVPRRKDDVDILKQDKELTTRQIAMYGFYIAPIWFITEVNPSMSTSSMILFFKLVSR